MISALCSLAASKILLAGTITPRSITSKLLHCRTTPTMFLPMSWTSPLTVAMMIVPLVSLPPTAPDSAFSASIYGSRYATAFFITRADFTTWGRNILPAPKRSPTTFIPSISGPSITSIGRPPAAAISARNSSVSASTLASIPLTRACVMRSRTGRDRHSAATGSSAFSELLNRSAISSNRSAASSRRFRTTSSIRSRNSGSIES